MLDSLCRLLLWSEPEWLHAASKLSLSTFWKGQGCMLNVEKSMQLTDNSSKLSSCGHMQVLGGLTGLTSFHYLNARVSRLLQNL